MEITEDLAYSLLFKFAKNYLACDDICIGDITGLPVLVPNKELIDKHFNGLELSPLLLIDGSTKYLEELMSRNVIKNKDPLYWKKVLIACLGKRISWLDCSNFAKSKYMPNTIEQLMIELDFMA